MSKLELFNAYLSERLTAAAREITSAVERTITDYQDEISRYKEDNERLRLLLDFKPHLHLHTKDPQQLTFTVSKEEVPTEQQHCEQVCPRTGQQVPEPTQIKDEEEEELLQESDTKDFITVCVVSDCEGVNTRHASHTVGSRAGGSPFNNTTGGIQTEPDDEDYIDYIVSEPSSPTAQSENSGRDTDGESMELPPGSKPRKSQRKRAKKGTSVVEEASPYSCKLCGRTFVRMGFLVNHVQRTHTKHAEQYRCGVCEGVLDSKENLTVHVQTHTKERTTPHSQTHTESKPWHNAHTQTLTEPKRWPGAHPQTLTEPKPRPSDHPQTLTDPKPWPSAHPQTLTDPKPWPSAHPQTLTEPKPRPSAHPQTLTEPKPRLTAHRQTFTKGMPTPQLQPAAKPTCHVCGKCFPYNHNLKLHMRTHTGERPFKCRECGKCFRSKGYMKVHLRIHTGEKLFQCKECDKGFPTKQYLTKHTLFHTGEKSYQCKDCGKGFDQREHLEQHQSTHTEEKPYGCIECGKCFKDTYHLARHKLVHTGERPFTCTVCGRGFSTQGNLKVHQRIHTGEKPYRCKLCGRCFTGFASLKYHLNTIHHYDGGL
ncbi:oocyte zinc finger protein XlCOF6 [Oncorhynchus tshawytscha]|uniref:C2H2-type domain-containing protein n=1 Tax=Oncorhynchus tshawytscha TaxID=74940 RepID=A0AAZ3SER1_ONCTS|nr:oocyte zinc finger protein XlCOF6 [Oncorhynchus tshawytscha]